MALAQSQLRLWHARDVNALEAAERALSINPNLAEARCVRAHALEEQGKSDEAFGEIEEALRVDPNSWEANREAARFYFRQGRVPDAIPYFKRAASVMDSDWHNPQMLVACYSGTNDKEKLHEAARMTVERTEKALARDPSNAPALAGGAAALGALGERDRARDWIERALLVAPDDIMMRYNLACALIVHLNDCDRAIELMAPYFEGVVSPMQLKHVDADPDMDPIRSDPRFQHLLATAKKRLRIEATVE
jgi:adenylate cyclase